MKNKTVIPGIQDQPINQGFPSSYDRQTQPFQASGSFSSTVVPRINNMNNDKGEPSQLVGFLYSVSRTLAGEYWPIYLGANTIGRTAGNSVMLSESTVSENHAVIHVISRANKLTVYIKDDQSKTGTLLNGELLRNDADLKTGDIITIGEHYELYVVLINPAELGLEVKEGFMPSVVSAFAGRNQRNAPLSSPATVVDGQVQSGQAPVGGHTVLM